MFTKFHENVEKLFLIYSVDKNDKREILKNKL